MYRQHHHLKWVQFSCLHMTLQRLKAQHTPSDSVTATIMYATHSACHSAGQRSKVPPVNVTVTVTELLGVNQPLKVPLTKTVTLTVPVKGTLSLEHEIIYKQMFLKQKPLHGKNRKQNSKIKK